MAVSIKSPHEIELMRESCRLLSIVFAELEKEVRPGVSTWEINKKGEELIRSFGCTPNFLNYQGYPASICTSVNEVVVHGIPDKKQILAEGDIISLDAGLIYQGYHSDMARTVAVGQVSPQAKKLMEVTEESFFRGIAFAREGNHLYDISEAIQNYCESFGYGIVRELCGHGIGTHLHEDPEVPNFKSRGRGMKLRAGMTIAVEPMVTMGNYAVSILDDDWTVVTDDKSYAAHYENTILITKGDPEILTLPGGRVKV